VVARAALLGALLAAAMAPSVTPTGASAAAQLRGVGTASASLSPAPAVMRASRVSAGQLAAWYRSATPVAYRATVPVDVLAQLFIEEGRDERVAGDLAFVQSVLETGWFGFSGRVPASANNFAGIGATDATTDYHVFRSARIGVRGQIQHLRAYADPSVTAASLAHPLESPRFHLVSPKGKAPTWGHMGNGNWATDPGYSSKILALYADLLAYAEVPSFPDVPTGVYFTRPVAWMERSGITGGVGTSGLYRPEADVSRAQLATMLWRTLGRPRGGGHHFTDVVPGSYYEPAVAHLWAAGLTTGVGSPHRFDPDGTVTRAQAVTFLWRMAGEPAVAARHGFPDVAPGIWYDRAVSWASRHGITTGVGSTGRFQPDDPVTRAQVAALLHRAVTRPAAWTTSLPPTAP
jgi:hypothetical protein